MTERLQRPFTQPANKVNRRVSLINGDARNEAAWEGPKGLLASLTVSLGRAQIALVGGSLVVDAEGSTARAAYREAWRELRLSQHDTADLLRLKAMYRRLWLCAESTVKTLWTATDNQNEAIRGHLARQERDAATIERLEAENAALKAQLAEAQRAPEEVIERVTKLEQRLLDAQIKASGYQALLATTQGRCDEMAVQLGVPTSQDLIVRGPGSKVYPLASQVSRDAASAGEGAQS